MLGQPELDKLLARQDLRQLKQRIVFSEYIKPLDHVGTKEYIRHRLNSASSIGTDELFSSSAISLIYRASSGTPRLINILCHKALIAAYGRAHTRISIWHIARAVCDTPECHWLISRLSHCFALELFSPRKGLAV